MPAESKRVPVVSKARCVACGLCGVVCPHGCLEVENGVGTLVRPDACTGEGHCASACGHDAIRMRTMRVKAKAKAVAAATSGGA